MVNVPREGEWGVTRDVTDVVSDIEQPLSGRNLITPTDLLPKHATELEWPLVAPFNQVVDLAWHGPTAAMNRLKQVEDPPQGRPRRRVVDLVRHRLPLARPLVAHAALRHGIDQQRSGQYQQQPLNPTGFFTNNAETNNSGSVRNRKPPAAWA